MPNSIEELIQESFIKNKWTLSVAESCTGGAIASRLTKIAGSSQYFLGGVVAYSNELKMKFLDIKEETLKNYGAVSAETAVEMASKIKLKTNSDFSLAVTGIAGPAGGSPEKPVGTVWVAISTPKKLGIWSLKLNGSRQQIIEQTVETILNRLWKLINE